MPTPIPGIKLGLANIVTLIGVVYFTPVEVFVIVIVRTLLASIFTGGLTVFLFSLAGGLLSSAVMPLMYHMLKGKFSLTGISMAGAFFHNVGQLGVAAVFMKDTAVFAYLPVLTVSALIMGALTGMTASFVVKYLNKTNIMNK
jgi:heptaprenyl diphosphate synthase